MRFLLQRTKWGIYQLLKGRAFADQSVLREYGAEISDRLRRADDRALAIATAAAAGPPKEEEEGSPPEGLDVFDESDGESAVSTFFDAQDEAGGAGAAGGAAAAAGKSSAGSAASTAHQPAPHGGFDWKRHGIPEFLVINIASPYERGPMFGGEHPAKDLGMHMVAVLHVSAHAVGLLNAGEGPAHPGIRALKATLAAGVAKKAGSMKMIATLDEGGSEGLPRFASRLSGG